MQDHADGRRPVGRRSSPRSSSRRSAATAGARTSTSGRRSTRARSAIGVKLHGLEHELYVLTVPFGNYVDVDNGIRIGTVVLAPQRRHVDPGARQDRRRLREPGVPEDRGVLNGFDEALVLTQTATPRRRRRRTCSSSATASSSRRRSSDDILEGITRKAIMQLAQDDGHPGRGALHRPHRAVHRRRGLPVRHRRQLSPVIEVDRRPVGSGGIGPIDGSAQGPLLRHRPRPRARIPPLADADRAERGLGSARVAARGP